QRHLPRDAELARAGAALRNGGGCGRGSARRVVGGRARAAVSRGPGRAPDRGSGARRVVHRGAGPRAARRERPLPRAGARGRVHRETEALLVNLPPNLELAVKSALGKKAEEVVLLDLRQAAAFTDYFLLLSGTNQKQLVAIADAVLDALKAQGRRP